MATAHLVIAPNVSRNFFHMLNATWGVLAYHYVASQTIAVGLIGTLALFIVGGEIARLKSPRFNRWLLRFALVGRVIRPHEENRVSGAAFFVVGVLVTLVAFPLPAVEVAGLVMGFGDASATLVGTHWGRHKLIGERSIEGTLAFVVAAFFAVVLFRGAFYPEAGAALNVGIAFGAAALGAVLEAISTRIDDNLVLPVATGAAVTPFV